MKRENMEKTDIIMSEEKKKRLKEKNIKKITVWVKRLNLINKIVLIVHAKQTDGDKSLIIHD